MDQDEPDTGGRDVVTSKGVGARIKLGLFFEEEIVELGFKCGQVLRVIAAAINSKALDVVFLDLFLGHDNPVVEIKFRMPQHDQDR